MGIDAEIDTSQGGDIIQTLKDEVICSICCAIFEVSMILNSLLEWKFRIP